MPRVRKPHVCPICCQGFMKSGNLLTHLAKNHSQRSLVPRTRSRTVSPTSHIDEQTDSITISMPHVYPIATEDTFFQNKDPVDVPQGNRVARDREAIASDWEQPPTIQTISSAGDAADFVFTASESRSLESSLGFEPFLQQSHFNFAAWLVENGCSSSAINKLFDKKTPMPFDESLKLSFKSAHTLNKRIDEMPDGLGWQSWQHATTSLTWKVDNAEGEPVTFYYREPLECARWLLGQKAYLNHMVYSPEQRFYRGNTETKRRVYSEMNTADWWWETQQTLPEGSTLVPLIFMSDATNLTRFSGDKKAWPIYMTIGNLSTRVRTKPSTRCVVLVCLLPVPTKLRRLPESKRKLQQIRNREVFVEVMKQLLRGVRLEGSEFYARCADGHVRHCFPRLAAWLADYPEHVTLQGIRMGFCPWCEIDKDSLGTLPDTASSETAPRDHAKYARLYTQDSDEAFQELEDVGLGLSTENPLWATGADVGDLPKPDLLHTMLLGMLKHLLDWLESLLHAHNRLDRFDRTWVHVPAYLDMTKPKRAYGEVAMWQGKEIRTMTRFLLAVLTAALDSPTYRQRWDFNEATQCTRALLEFYMYCNYETHDSETIDLMKDALKQFHDTKGVFLQYRAAKGVSATARARRTELNQERDAELAEYRSGAARRRLRAEWQLYIDTEVREVLEEGSHFNFPKIHLMYHFPYQVERFGSLMQWDTNTSEMAHKSQVKEGYEHSSKTSDYDLQMLNHYLKQDAFAMRALNTNPLHSYDSDLSDQAPMFIAPQHKKGKNRISTLASLLQHAAIDGFDDALRRYEMDVGDPGTESDSVNRETAIAALYHGIRIPAQKHGSGEWYDQNIRCSLNKPWYGGPPCRDWVWWRTVELNRANDFHVAAETQSKRWGALHGRLPVRLRCLFKVQLTPGKDSHLALVDLTQPVKDGKPDPHSMMPRVAKPTGSGDFHINRDGVALKVIDAGQIDGPAHCVPVTVEPDGKTTQWIVNVHIDHQTWNFVYVY